MSPPSPHAAPAEPRLERWFADEVQPHEGGLRAYLRHAFPTVRDVDDVVQESYLRTWRRQLARPIGSARAFLFTVARHVALDTVRSARRSPVAAEADLGALPIADESAGAAEALCRREEFAVLLDAVDALPARAREIFILRKFEGLPQKEIAARLGLSENTVEVQIGRAHRRCEEFLRARGVIAP